MRFGILGTTRVWRDDGSEVAVGGTARRALLTLLVARVGEVVTADSLIDDLYGTKPGAVHALQSQVSRLRQDLRQAAVIEMVPGGYRLSADPDDVDARRFERLADEGRNALGNGRPGRAAEVLRTALALWRGPALADVEPSPAQAVRLEERRLGALEDRIEADLQRGEHRAAVPELQELTGRHPLRERLHGLLMRALQAAGRPAEALVLFEDVRRRLADELGADPSAELTAIHRALLRGDRPTAVPAQLTSFVGRADDLAEVTRLLGDARLVTLLGPGGSGKTRLSIEVAAGRTDVCFVELAALRHGSEVPQAVLGALGLREGGLLPAPAESTPMSKLITALAERSLLLILDNCEHVVMAAAELTEGLLATCPAVRVLATSREPLTITGENLWPVRPLDASHAARLFADRAAAVRPGFTLDPATAATVRQICAALDGLPLAIELAAARMRTHEVAELAARLDDRFRLLSRGSRTAAARHQTLRGVVAWSWDLLSTAEKVMARRLTVFSGGATAAAAQLVCGVPDAEGTLDSLAEKSLVEVGDGRYRMLDTIHAYCAERLAEAGETAGLRRAHANHFLDLAQAADPFLRGSEQLRWLKVLIAEHENLQTALHRAIEDEEVDLALRLIASLSSYRWIRGLRTSATPQAVAILGLIGDRRPELTDEYVLCALAAAVGAEGRQAWARHRPVTEAIVSAPDRPRPHPLITFLWPMINASTGNPQASLALIKRGRTSSDPWERAVVELMQGYSHLAGSDLAAAEQEFTGAADGFRALGDRWGTALALDSLAALAVFHGDHPTALTLTGEALVLTEELGADEDLADLLCNRGDHRRHLGDLAGARADFERAAELARRAGTPTYLAAALRGLGDIARLRGDLTGAHRLYEQALERFEPHWIRSAGHRASALYGLGKTLEAMGDLAGARGWHRAAIEVAVTQGPLPEGARAVEALAGIALGEGDAATAALLLGAAASLRGVLLDGDSDVAPIAARTREVLGGPPYDVAVRTGRRLGHGELLRLVGLPEDLPGVAEALAHRP
ncbi:BTAD domain-containing putative transcriptional regulator [Streptosporangium soli]|nr:tetratricopeptide repeat protein [Streptosporangium sp. KLBMP 9127]